MDAIAKEATEVCMYCGKPLAGDHDGWAHAACERVVKADDAATEVRDSRDLETAERALRYAGRCSRQIKPNDWDGSAIYCGREVTNTGGDEPDLFCAEHQCEDDGDEDGAAEERAARTLSLLEQAISPPAPPTTTGGTMTTETAPTGETYTHRAWLDWAQNSIDLLADLQSELDTWCAQIEADDGDKSQVDAIRRWQAEIEGVTSAGRRMVDEVNTTQLPVGEAVAAAGGSDNTPHKQYADEARTR
jgi:hypothetical protein